MPFNAALVGQTFGPVIWEATARRVLAFRALMEPEDRASLDDAAPGGLTASPFNCVSPEWALSLALRGAPGQILTDAEARRGVHTGQDTRFLSPIRTGDRLRVTATLTGARESRAGTVVSVRYDAVREADGATVWQTRSSSLYRDVALNGVCAPGDPRPDSGGDSSESAATRVRLAAGLPHLYSECAEIWNPIHTEREVALAAGLPDIIVHGTALWALAGQALIRERAGGDGRRLGGLACAFVGQALPGQTAQLLHHATGDDVAWRLVSEAGAPLAVGRAYLRTA